MTPLEAAVTLAARFDIQTRDPRILKDGSNLLAHLAPAPVVVRVARLPGRIRREPLRLDVAAGDDQDGRAARTWTLEQARPRRGRRALDRDPELGGQLGLGGPKLSI